MEDIAASGEFPLEESDLLALPTEQEQLSLDETPMVYKAHAVVGAAIFIEGFKGDIQKLSSDPRTYTKGKVQKEQKENK